MPQRPTSFAIKTEIRDPTAAGFVFPAQKTMYGGRSIAVGDRIFVFDSENEGGPGLLARGTVIASSPVPRTDAARQTPRVSIAVERTGTANEPCGRSELRAFKNWQDGQPETEINFKLYRQATNKIIGLSEDAAAFLEGFF